MSGKSAAAPCEGSLVVSTASSMDIASILSESCQNYALDRGGSFFRDRCFLECVGLFIFFWVVWTLVQKRLIFFLYCSGSVSNFRHSCVLVVTCQVDI